MRARNIKPGYFKNEELAKCHPLARLLFAGLWMVADREGKLEDRPARIRADVLPYDDCDVNDLLNQLAERGFIIRYAVNGVRCIKIPTFQKHSRPHPREQPSDLPEPELAIISGTISAMARHEPCLFPAEAMPSREKALPAPCLDVKRHGQAVERCGAAQVIDYQSVVDDESEAVKRHGAGNAFSRLGALNPESTILNAESLSVLAQQNQGTAPPSPTLANIASELWGKEPIQYDPVACSFVGVTTRNREVWKRAYPSVDIEAELARAADWCDAHAPGKGDGRGKKKNYQEFLNRWLSRSQDRGGSNGRQDWSSGAGGNGMGRLSRVRSEPGKYRNVGITIDGSAPSAESASG